MAIDFSKVLKTKESSSVDVTGGIDFGKVINEKKIREYKDRQLTKETTVPKQSFFEKYKTPWSFVKDIATGDYQKGEYDPSVGRFLKQTGTNFVSMGADAVDFVSDYVGYRPEKILGAVTPPAFKVLATKVPKNNKVYNEWKNAYKEMEDSGMLPPDKAKKYTDELLQKDYMANRPEWEQASLKDKVTKYLPETLYNLGPSIVSSIGWFGINPAVGVGVIAGSTAEDVSDSAEKYGVEKNKAQDLGLITGVFVSALDRIVPSKTLSREAKNKFIGGFTKRILKSGTLEAGTESAQESIQLAAEVTFRDDLGLDEVQTRTAMSALGGFFGGTGMESVSTLNASLKDKGITQEDLNKIKDIPKVTEEAPPTIVEARTEEVGKRQVDELIERQTPAEIQQRVQEFQEKKITTKVSKELEPLYKKAKKYKTADEFVKSYDGGLILNKEKVNSWIAGGPDNVAPVSELLGPEGKKFMKDMDLPDIPVRVQEAGEDTIGHSAQIEWRGGNRLKDAAINIEISPMEEFGIESLIDMESNLLHELAHAKQITLNRLRIKKIQGEISERSAQKHANYIIKKAKSQLTDIWNKATKKVVKVTKEDLAKKEFAVVDLNEAKNSIAKTQITKPKGIERAKMELEQGISPPVRVRRLEDGTLFIEDGTHRVEAARQLGLEELPIEDVTAFYEEAPGEKTGIAKTIEAKAIEENLTKGFSDIAEYTPVVIKEQSEKIEALMAEDIEKAKRMVTGLDPVQQDIRGAMLLATMSNYAMETKDGKLLSEIANSPIATEVSEAGQTLRLTSELYKDSAFTKIQEVKKERENAVKKALKKETKKEIKGKIVKDAKEKIKKNKPKKKDWNNLINEITCKYD